MKSKLTFVLFTLIVSAGACIAQTPAQVEQRVLDQLKKIGVASNYGGNSDYDVLERENKALHDLLARFGNRADVLRYPFAKAKDVMYVTTSRDGRLRAYSWDAETGGTMHDFITVYQYLDASGKAHAWAPAYDIAESAGGFVHDIFQTDTGSGPIYLAVDTFIGSSSLCGQSISAFKIQGKSLNTNPKVIRTAKGLTDSISFQYDFFSVVDRPGRPVKLFKFDAATKTFSFPVVIEDDNSPQGRVTDKLIRYRFDGTHFVKVA